MAISTRYGTSVSFYDFFCLLIQLNLKDLSVLSSWAVQYFGFNIYILNARCSFHFGKKAFAIKTLVMCLLCTNFELYAIFVILGFAN
jgi:hypothetical protein